MAKHAAGQYQCKRLFQQPHLPRCCNRIIAKRSAMRCEDLAGRGIARIPGIEQGTYQLTPILGPRKFARRHPVQYLFDSTRPEKLQNPFSESCRRVDP